MWPTKRLTDLFEIALPIVQAPMAGVQDADIMIGAAEGGAMGSITMTSYLLGCNGLRQGPAHPAPAAALPDPDTVPPEQTNS